MAFSRTRALRSLQSSLRYSGKRVVPRASARTQLVQRRYASGGGHGEEKSSDIPWAIGAVAVTIPSCYFLWPDQSAGHGEHGGHEEHEEKEEEKEEEAPQEEESKDESKDEGEDSKAESKEADDKADKDAGGEEKKEGKPTETSGNASKSLPPGGDDSQTKKGGGKKEESKDDSGDDESKDDSKDEGSDEGESEEKDESKDEAGKPKKSSDPTKRPKGAKGSMEEKQYGFSNTDTRHPYKDDSGRSRKSDGSIETSKTMGTVDPSQPLK